MTALVVVAAAKSPVALQFFCLRLRLRNPCHPLRDCIADIFRYSVRLCEGVIIYRPLIFVAVAVMAFVANVAHALAALPEFVFAAVAHFVRLQ